MHPDDQRPDSADTSEDDSQGQNHTGEGYNYSSSMDSPTDDDSDEETGDAVDLCLHSCDMGDHFVFPYYHLYDFQIFEIKPKEWRAFPFAEWDPSLFVFEPGEGKKEKWIKTAKGDSPLNRLMKMVGFNDVKKEFLSVLHRVKAARLNEAQLPSIRSLRLDLLISGDAESERSMIADLYKKLLEFLGVSSGCCWTKPDDIKCNMDYKELGAIVLDNNISFHHHDRDKHVLIGLGSREHIRNILSQSWAKGRFHLRFDLKGYSEDELLAILVNELKERNLRVQGGLKAPFLRMFIRQVRNRQDDPNNLGLEQLKSEIEKVISRRSERLETTTRREGTAIMSLSRLSYELQESDFFGNYPIKLYDENESFKKLDKMAGMERVNEAVPQYDRRLRNSQYFRSLFHNLVGFETIIETFEGYQTMAAHMNTCGLNPRGEVPFSFIFKGPPGTGKTMTARALGKMYYSMGLLPTTEVMDCSVTDMIGKYAGQTGPKVRNLLEEALGKVLFIDEAYRLGFTTYDYPREAVGELVNCMTKERYMHKLVIVLAGYERSMDQLISTNEGLRSRFTEMVFPKLRPKDCLRLLQAKLLENKINILSSTTAHVQKVITLFKKLGKTEAWANARDVGAIAKEVTRQLFMKPLPAGQPMEITLEAIARVLKRFYRDRRSKEKEEEAGDSSES